jgi:hypothetical protein
MADIPDWVFRRRSLDDFLRSRQRLREAIVRMTLYRCSLSDADEIRGADYAISVLGEELAGKVL